MYWLNKLTLSDPAFSEIFKLNSFLAAFKVKLNEEEPMQKQSGHPSANEKNEGLKTAKTSEGTEAKNVRSVRGSDNGAVSDEDLDQDEIQQAGGNNNGGIVPGAHGRDTQADGHKSLNEGM